MAPKKISYDDADITYTSANNIRKGSYVMLRNEAFPCQVSEYSKSKTGKHGSAKIKVIGYDVFTQKRYDDLFMSTENVAVPAVRKVDLKLLFIDDQRYARIQNADGTNREDLRLPDDNELASKIEGLFHEGNDDVEIWVTILSALNRDQIIGCKTSFVKEE